MKKALVVYTNGTEDIEVTATVDVLHRGGVKIVKAAVTDDTSRNVTLAHGTSVNCDLSIDEVNDTFDIIVLPGGPGTANLNKSTKLFELLLAQKVSRRYIGAICAAPGIVLYPYGIIDDLTRATVYPGCENGKTNFSKKGVEVSDDGLVITGKAPGYAISFALTILKALEGPERAEKVAADMMFQE